MRGTCRPTGMRNKATLAQGAIFAELAKSYSHMVFNALVDMAINGRSDSARIAAENAILDRGYGKVKNDTSKAGKLAGNIQSALQQGKHSDGAGELVARAIEEENLWILTHPRWAKSVQKQPDAMVSEQTLTRAGASYLRISKQSTLYLQLTMASERR